MIAAERPERAQLTGLEQCDQVEQLVQIVLDRRRGEEQEVGPPEPVHELPEDSAGVPQVMGLVHDDEVIRDLLNHAGMLWPLGRVEGGDHALEALPGLPPRLPERLSIMAHEVEVGLPPQLLLPLGHEPGRCQDQHAADEPSPRRARPG